MIRKLEKNTFTTKVDGIAAKTRGRLIIREYPTSSVNTLVLDSLIQELRDKQQFVPEVICVDYLNLILSSRFTSGHNSYTVIKGVAEELRGIAVKYNAIMFSATPGPALPLTRIVACLFMPAATSS
jgi:hypothetical protein